VTCLQSHKEKRLKEIVEGGEKEHTGAAKAVVHKNARSPELKEVSFAVFLVAYTTAGEEGETQTPIMHQEKRETGTHF